MRTLHIIRPLGTACPVHVTTTRGSQQLSPAVLECFRRAGLMPPRLDPPEPPKKIPHIEVDGLARCAAHGVVPSTGCPSGCSRRYLGPVYTDDTDLPPVDKGGGESLMVPKVLEPDDDDGELAMTEEEVRATLTRILSHCPRGAQRPLSRVLGYRGRWSAQTMRGVAKRGAMLPEAVRCRLSPILRQIMRGELVPASTGQLHTAGRPSMSWARADSAAGRNSRVPFTP